MILAAIVGHFLGQANAVDSDNLKIFTCINDQMEGRDSRGSDLSIEFKDRLSMSDSRPSQRFWLYSENRTRDRLDTWRYPTTGDQDAFVASSIKSFHVPFPSWKNHVEHNSPDGNPNYLGFINKYIDGILDGLDCIHFSVNFSSGRITGAGFEMRGAPVTESKLITDKMVQDQIKLDGVDYEIESDILEWTELPKPLKFHTFQPGEVRQDTRRTVPIYKLRLVNVKRSAGVHRYTFRMDGSLAGKI